MLYFFWQLAPKGGASIVQNLHISQLNYSISISNAQIKCLIITIKSYLFVFLIVKGRLRFSC